MPHTTILYTVDAAVATITLNRPASLNAFTDPMIAETVDAVRQADRDAGVRCVVLTGAGRGFSSGQDLTAFDPKQPGFSIGDHLRGGYHRLVKAIIALEKPVIGAINGAAAGAGCGLALACDYRVASEKAYFMLAFTKLGLIPDCGTNWLLPRLIGYGRAYQMALTAERVPAARALEWGMVNAVASEGEFSETVRQTATSFASGATRAFGLTKRAMHRAFSQDLADALEYEAHVQDAAGRTSDFAEGLGAFLAKRPASFTGA